MARLFFMAIPAFFAFLLTYIVFGADKDSLIGGLVIAAIICEGKHQCCSSDYFCV